MEFDRTRLFTELDNDLPQVGSKGFFCDDLIELWDLLDDSQHIHAPETETLIKVRTRGHGYRYETKGVAYNFFYLIEEPTKGRDFTEDEFIQWWESSNCKVERKDRNEHYLATGYFFNTEDYAIKRFKQDALVIKLDSLCCSLEEFCATFNMADGTPFEVME